MAFIIHQIISIAKEECILRHVLYAISNHLIKSTVYVVVATLLTSLLNDFTWNFNIMQTTSYPFWVKNFARRLSLNPLGIGH